MSEQLKITSLSDDIHHQENRRGNTIVMVGSFAPIHRGHFDAAHAASVALTDRGVPIESLVLTPNSAEYVQKKLPEYYKEWTYERRIQEILDRAPHPYIPTYVDDISGYAARHEQINNHVPLTIRRYLGFKAHQIYLVVGSDQLLSMESHLRGEMNRAVCVLRPGNLDRVQEQLQLPWAAEAIESGRFIVTEREDMQHDISSTVMRRLVVIE